MSNILKKNPETLAKTPLERARLALADISTEEDASITADALLDADNPPAGALFARRGRPAAENPKERITIRVDSDVLTHFKANGPGWQTRVNAALRKAAGLQ
ncbi:BrnA antitoxin family protein [Pararhizobium sp. O133]|uniref:BrnA antitoxin family protein n=1 Tax=Pararhizobium sp. O133 TaxID=3449278 RepID=UPI003F6859CF